MSTKNPKPPSHTSETKTPETRLTFSELLKLGNIVYVDLRRLETIDQLSPGILTEALQEHKALIAKLDQMRTEAWQRESFFREL